MILHIGVANKIATFQKRDGCIVCGNDDYKIKFTFDSEWDAYSEKTARFIWNRQYTDVDFTGDTCDVPIINDATDVKVGVYAGELRTTTSAEIGCYRSIRCDSVPPSTENDRHYANEAKEAAERAEAAAERAENAGGGGGLPVNADEVINKIIDPDNNPLSEDIFEETQTIVLESGRFSTNDGTERDDSGLRTPDFIDVRSYSTITPVLNVSNATKIRILFYDSSQSYLGEHKSFETGETFKISDYASKAVYIRGFVSFDDESYNPGYGEVTLTFVGSSKTIAEHKKVYFADHGYSIYGNDVDDETMHKLVLAAEGKDGNTFNITEIKAPTHNPEEATLALMNWGNGRKQFVDFSSMVYNSEKPTVEIVCQTRGGEPLPEFSVRYNNGESGRVKKFVVHPDAIPIELTSTGLKVRRNNNFDNNGNDDDFAIINLFDLANTMNNIGILQSPSGKRFNITVDDNGTLATTEIT